MANKKELRNLFKGIADAIRTKEGSKDLISARDFPERISNLSGGGGSQYRYFDISGVDDKWALYNMFSIIKNYYSEDERLEINTIAAFDGAVTIAAGFDCNAKIHLTYEGVEEYLGEQPMTMNHYWEAAVNAGVIPPECVEITEEEFYNVN